MLDLQRACIPKLRWSGEKKFFEARVLKVLDAERSIWHIKYADNTDEYLRPTAPLKASGKGRRLLVVVEGFEVYKWDPQRQELVLDELQGEDPALLAGPAAAAAAGKSRGPAPAQAAKGSAGKGQAELEAGQPPGETSPPTLPPGIGSSKGARPPLAGGKRKASARATPSASAATAPTPAGSAGGVCMPSETKRPRTSARAQQQQQQTPSPSTTPGLGPGPAGAGGSSGRGAKRSGKAATAGGTAVPAGRLAKAPTPPAVTAPSSSEEDEMPLVAVAAAGGSRGRNQRGAGSVTPSTQTGATPNAGAGGVAEVGSAGGGGSRLNDTAARASGGQSIRSLGKAANVSRSPPAAATAGAEMPAAPTAVLPAQPASSSDDEAPLGVLATKKAQGLVSARSSGIPGFSPQAAAAGPACVVPGAAPPRSQPPAVAAATAIAATAHEQQTSPPQAVGGVLGAVTVTPASAPALEASPAGSDGESDDAPLWQPGLSRTVSAAAAATTPPAWVPAGDAHKLASGSKALQASGGPATSPIEAVPIAEGVSEAGGSAPKGPSGSGGRRRGQRGAQQAAANAKPQRQPTRQQPKRGRATAGDGDSPSAEAAAVAAPEQLQPAKRQRGGRVGTAVESQAPSAGAVPAETLLSGQQQRQRGGDRIVFEPPPGDTPAASPHLELAAAKRSASPQKAPALVPSMPSAPGIAPKFVFVTADPPKPPAKPATKSRQGASDAAASAAAVVRAVSEAARPGGQPAPKHSKPGEAAAAPAATAATAAVLPVDTAGVRAQGRSKGRTTAAAARGLARGVSAEAAGPAPSSAKVSYGQRQRQQQQVTEEKEQAQQSSIPAEHVVASPAAAAAPAAPARESGSPLEPLLPPGIGKAAQVGSGVQRSGGGETAGAGREAAGGVEDAVLPIEGGETAGVAQDVLGAELPQQVELQQQQQQRPQGQAQQQAQRPQQPAAPQPLPPPPAAAAAAGKPPHTAKATALVSAAKPAPAVSHAAPLPWHGLPLATVGELRPLGSGPAMPGRSAAARPSTQRPGPPKPAGQEAKAAPKPPSQPASAGTGGGAAGSAAGAVGLPKPTPEAAKVPQKAREAATNSGDGGTGAPATAAAAVAPAVAGGLSETMHEVARPTQKPPEGSRALTKGMLAAEKRAARAAAGIPQPDTAAAAGLPPTTAAGGAAMTSQPALEPRQWQAHSAPHAAHPEVGRGQHMQSMSRSAEFQKPWQEQLLLVHQQQQQQQQQQQEQAEAVPGALGELPLQGASHGAILPSSAPPPLSSNHHQQLQQLERQEPERSGGRAPLPPRPAQQAAGAAGVAQAATSTAPPATMAAPEDGRAGAEPLRLPQQRQQQELLPRRAEQQPLQQQQGSLPYARQLAPKEPLHADERAKAGPAGAAAGRITNANLPSTEGRGGAEAVPATGSDAAGTAFHIPKRKPAQDQGKLAEAQPAGSAASRMPERVSTEGGKEGSARLIGREAGADMAIGDGGSGGFRIPKRDGPAAAAAGTAGAEPLQPRQGGDRRKAGDGRGGGGAIVIEAATVAPTSVDKSKDQQQQRSSSRGGAAPGGVARRPAVGPSREEERATRLLADNRSWLARQGSELEWGKKASQPASAHQQAQQPQQTQQSNEPPAQRQAKVEPQQVQQSQHGTQQAQRPKQAQVHPEPVLRAVKAVQERYKAWPTPCLLPDPSSLADPLPFPEDIEWGRIIVTTNASLNKCLERKTFISNHPRDVLDVSKTTMLLVHNIDERLVYGCFRCLEKGENLDDSFNNSSYKYHVRVKWLADFDPLPDRLLELFVPRKLHQETKQRMKFFEKNFDKKVAQELWQAYKFFHQRRISRNV
ncbi:hypothetical protein N2152v2_009505 [Parachlorella kessleri]